MGVFRGLVGCFGGGLHKRGLKEKRRERFLAEAGGSLRESFSQFSPVFAPGIWFEASWL